MNLLPLTCDEVRLVDKIAIDEFNVPGVILMENAGRNAAHVLMDKSLTGSVVIVCGKGNNGGDGFVIARHLDNNLIPVQIFLTVPPEELKGDSKINYDIIKKSGIDVQQLNSEDHLNGFRETLKQCDWVVDALLGTGVSGEIKGLYKSIIEEINNSQRPVLSVDIPSGMDCDTGNVLGTAVISQCTVTFVARKKGFDNPNSRLNTGDIHVADIGVPRSVLNQIIKG